MPLTCHGADSLYFFWSVCKFSFVVDVEPGDEVKLDPNEHEAFLWVSEEEARLGKCGDVEFKYTTARQKQIVLAAFELRRKEGRL